MAMNVGVRTLSNPLTHRSLDLNRYGIAGTRQLTNQAASMMSGFNLQSPSMQLVAAMQAGRPASTTGLAGLRQAYMAQQQPQQMPQQAPPMQMESTGELEQLRQQIMQYQQQIAQYEQMIADYESKFYGGPQMAQPQQQYQKSYSMPQNFNQNFVASPMYQQRQTGQIYIL